MIGFLKRWWKSLAGSTDEPVLRTIERIREHSMLGARRLELPYEEWRDLLDYLEKRQRYIGFGGSNDSFLFEGMEIARKDRE